MLLRKEKASFSLCVFFGFSALALLMRVRANGLTSRQNERDVSSSTIGGKEREKRGSDASVEKWRGVASAAAKYGEKQYSIFGDI